MATLLVLMFHRARAGRHGNSAAVLDAHFAHVAHAARVVLPGDELAPAGLNVCLSFDDGYYDFRATVFPLLQKHRLRALLAIPPAVIRAHVAADPTARLALDIDAAFADPDAGGFCTWGELGEMVASGLVAVAAHGLTHRRLDRGDVDLEAEVDAPRQILAERLGQEINSFVFPFGRFSAAALQRARARYRHVFRIGEALNHDWHARVLYRIDADEMAGPTALLERSRLRAYRRRHYWNRLRRR